MHRLRQPAWPPQQVFAEFAGGGAGQGVDETVVAGILKPARVFPGELRERLGRWRCAGAWGDVRDDPPTHPPSGADDRDVVDVGCRIKASSISRGQMLTPPEMMRLVRRSARNR